MLGSQPDQEGCLADKDNIAVVHVGCLPASQRGALPAFVLLVKIGGLLNRKFFCSALLITLGLCSSAYAAPAQIPWVAGPNNTLRAPGTITKLKNISLERALYRLTSHGNGKEPALSASETGTVPEATICFTGGNTCFKYPFVAQYYAPGTEPLQLKVGEAVWVATKDSWPSLRVFPRT